jgi:uncharacterized membrane protein YphA (DoxX/SURF4 family)
MTRPQWTRDALSFAFRWVLAVSFVWACLHKIADPFDFGLQVATYQMLPLSLVNLQAIVLPWLELIVGLLLIAGLMTRAAALLTCGMNIMFIVAIAYALASDLNLQCGCFSSSEVGEQMDASLLVRDGILLLMGLYLTVARPDRLSVDHLLSQKRRSK